VQKARGREGGDESLPERCRSSNMKGKWKSTREGRIAEFSTDRPLLSLKHLQKSAQGRSGKEDRTLN